MPDHAHPQSSHPHGNGPAGGHDGHSHGVALDADRRYLTGALALIVVFLIVEVVVGVIAGSLALITDAGHMLTDAASIALALLAIRLSAKPAQGRWTYGFKRAEILSAQANGLTLLLLAVWFVYEGIHRLIDPPEVEGLLVFITAMFGIAVNIVAAWLISKANRTSLNVEGAFQHILNDLYAFIATAIAGLLVMFTGFARADAIAALIVAALMIKGGYGLVRESGRIFLEAAPANLDPDLIGPAMAARPCVAEVHDLHIWDVTSGMPSLSAHILVDPTGDCHAVRRDLEVLLRGEYRIDHTTLQVDHAKAGSVSGEEVSQLGENCEEPHGRRHVPAGDAELVPTVPTAPSEHRPH
ncbi:cobalt-zinc-cadmium efflux system protein [Nakamurella sp. UYEF19]|uniref:cation diffusion facilitator family transporter n=1 Tax=Nakamurella sp. UYEF19 TaxID=1756392 RepID=UPI00339743CD